MVQKRSAAGLIEASFEMQDRVFFPLEKEERSFLADFSIRPKYYFLYVATLLCCTSTLSPAFQRYFDCVSPR